MSQISNKIGIHKINNDFSEVIHESLKEKLSFISTESSKIVLDRLQPFLHSNKIELNSLSDHLSKLKKVYKIAEKDIKPINFKNKSKEISVGIRKLKKQINENNDLIQSHQEISSNDNKATNNLNQCLNNLDSVIEMNSGKYRMNNVSEFSDKLSELSNYFITQTNSLESAVSSHFDNGLTQREELKEKLQTTFNKLEEIKFYFNQKQNFKNVDFLIEKENFNYLNQNQMQIQSQVQQNITNNGFINSTSNYNHFSVTDGNSQDKNGNIAFYKFSAEDLAFL
jgi:hypothetical protein